MNVVLLYFTGTNNTAIVCDILSDELNHRDIRAQAINISQAARTRPDTCTFTPEQLQAVTDATHFILATPTYMSNVPEAARDIFRDLFTTIPLGGRPFGTIATHAGGAGRTCRTLAEIGIQHGGIFFGSWQLCAVSNYRPFGPAIVPDRVEVAYWPSCNWSDWPTIVEEAVGHIRNPPSESVPLPPRTAMGVMLGWMASDKKARIRVSADDRCIGERCQKCVKGCVSGAMSFSPETGIIQDYDRCVGCTFCANACPMQCLNYREDKLGWYGTEDKIIVHDEQPVRLPKSAVVERFNPRTYMQ